MKSARKALSHGSMGREGAGARSYPGDGHIRAPHGRRSRSVKVAVSHKTPLETLLLVLAWVGFVVPLIWVVSPAFSFAEYPLRNRPLAGGVTCLAIGLWLFYRSHADLGTNRSITLEVHRVADTSIDALRNEPMLFP